MLSLYIKIPWDARYLIWNSSILRHFKSINKSIDGGRRFSKVSTHEPTTMDQLIGSRKLKDILPKKSINESDDDYKGKDLDSESQDESEVQFKINVEHASSKSDESIKIFTNQAQWDDQEEVIIYFKCDHKID